MTYKIITGIFFVFSLALAQNNVFLGNIIIKSDTIPSQLKSEKRIQLPYSAEKLKDISAEVQEAYYKCGYPFAEIYLTDVQINSDDSGVYLNPEFEVNPGRLAIIDTLIFTGLENTNPEFMTRLMLKLKKDTFKGNESLYIERELLRYPYIFLSSSPELMRMPDERFGLIIPIQEKSGSEFSGIAGYIPDKGGRNGTITGDIKIRFANISGYGREFAVHWKKPNRESQELEISFWYPFIFSSFVNLETSYRQELRDTLFISRKIDLNLNRSRGNYLYGIYFEWERINPTRGGKVLLGLKNEKLLRSGADYRLDRFDIPLNPRKGYQLSARFDVAREEAGRYILSSVWQSEIILHLHSNLYLYLGAKYFGRWKNSGELPYSQFFWIGGTGKLRGYRDDFFAARTAGIGTIEIRYPFSKFGRIGVFGDFARLIGSSNEIKMPLGYGLSLQMETRMGILSLNYGMGKHDTISSAKVHLQIATKF